MSIWPPPATTLKRGDRVRVLYTEHAGREGTITNIRLVPCFRPLQVNFDDGERAPFESYELELVK